MSSKRVLIVVVAASVLLLAGSARALPPEQAPGLSGVTVPYPGHLANTVGEPVADGSYDFSFTLYDAETGGKPLWTETQKGVTVLEGSFATVLGRVNSIPADLAKGQGWLAVAVRGSGEASFTSLSPRQRLSSTSPAPASASSSSSCAHDHFGETWTGANWKAAFMAENTIANGAGIMGRANVGTTSAGVWGDSTSGIGVYGKGGDRGVWGESTAGDGVVGQTAGANKSGVYGLNTGGGYGVAGRSTNGWGLEADGKDVARDRLGDLRLDGNFGEIWSFGSAMQLYSDGSVEAYLDWNSNDDSFFRIYSGSSLAPIPILQVDEAGNLDVTGDMRAHGVKPAVVETDHYGQRLLYAVESPEVWFEDVGSASLLKGEATVPFEPVFAETVNLQEDYHVFLTALCEEPVLLFVTSKDAQGFSVRGVTLEGQPSNCAFDYRVAAKRLGYEDVRLQSVPEPAATGSQEKPQ